MIPKVLKSNFSTYKLVETEHKLKDKHLTKIRSFLRCNQQYEGYCFVPDPNGKIIRGAYIKKIELDNPQFIPRPHEIRYYDPKQDKYFMFQEIKLEKEDESYQTTDKSEEGVN